MIKYINQESHNNFLIIKGKKGTRFVYFLAKKINDFLYYYNGGFDFIKLTKPTPLVIGGITYFSTKKELINFCSIIKN